ncbi:MAG TPA: metal-dependent hydrolase [Thermoanaerobaculia bacterium]
MDPLTHALAGATLAWAATGARLGRRAIVIGAAAALLPDVDVLIRSAADPLLAIEHHRGFTHSLLFVPIGGVIAAMPFAARTQRRWAALAGILAYASHSFLDAATTYGTQLFWPFSRTRVGLDVISIIDPIFTLIVLTGVIAAFASRRRIAVITLTLAIAWLATGFVQRERATATQARIALHRGDPVHRAAVFPTIGNTLVWRSIYATTNGALRIDRVRVPWFGSATYAPVTTVPLIAREQVRGTTRMLRDFDRFAWFSDGWVASAPTDPAVIGDARYSLRADRYEPVWGIRFNPVAEPPTEWVNRTRNRDVGAARLWNEIRGADAAFRRVP